MELSPPNPAQLQREFNHYREAVEKTYSGLTGQQAYDLAYYDNLETSDPLGRCPYYRGTDQRDFSYLACEECLKSCPILCGLAISAPAMARQQRWPSMRFLAKRL